MQRSAQQMKNVNSSVCSGTFIDQWVVRACYLVTGNERRPFTATVEVASRCSLLDYHVIVLSANAIC